MLEDEAKALEAADIAKLQEAITKERENFSSRSIMLWKMDETKLRHAGFRTMGEALIFTVKSHNDKLKGLITAHERKWK